MSDSSNLFWLIPPYEVLRPVGHSAASPILPGTALVWFPTGEGLAQGELDRVSVRPRGTSLAIILPPPSQIREIADHLHRIGGTCPNVVLPYGEIAHPSRIRVALSGLPRNLPRAVTDYVSRHKIVTSSKARLEVFRIFELAPRTSTVNRLCRDLYLSRRTLGRHFEECGLPVPSHWLQFARILNVVLRSQTERLAVFKIALSAGYPDGFTMSNQLKRMTGFRPSEIRSLVGFEWLLERWLERERGTRDGQAEINDEKNAG
jgi:AraC-like DNA-binding protein